MEDRSIEKKVHEKMKILTNLKFLPCQLMALIQLKLRKARIGCNIKFRGFCQIKGRGRIALGNDVVINSGAPASPISCGAVSSIYVKSGAELSIGNNSGVSASALYCVNHISIGQNVMIGAGCKIFDTDFHPIGAEERRADGLSGAKNAPIVIGDDVFIGAGCIVCKGVTIGRGSVIGAGSVVTKAVPENELWAGNPARFVRKLEE